PVLVLEVGAVLEWAEAPAGRAWSAVVAQRLAPPPAARSARSSAWVRHCRPAHPRRPPQAPRRRLHRGDRSRSRSPAPGAGDTAAKANAPAGRITTLASTFAPVAEYQRADDTREALLRRLGGYADDRVMSDHAARNVHGLNHLLILGRWIALHEQDLFRTSVKRGVEHLTQTSGAGWYGLLVDQIRAILLDFEHDLIRAGRSRRLDSRIRELHVERLPSRWHNHHEDDEKYQQHVDHRGQIRLGREAAASTAC